MGENDHRLNHTLGYEYDGIGNRTALFDSGVGRTEYVYDRLHRLERIENPYGEVTRMFYDDLNREVRRELPNTVRQEHEYK